MRHKRKLPAGTVGWVGSTMRENQQEDVFLVCDDRLVAVNVGADPAYASLVYDTNQKNGFDPERSARLHSAFRVLKEPFGEDNAIGFQLNYSGKDDTQGGFFVDLGDGGDGNSTSTTGGATVPSSGDVDTTTGGTAGQTMTGGAGGGMAAQGGVTIGQGSYHYSGPLHVGASKGDKHYHGDDADGNPINGLHIWAKMNFYLNQVEDGPLRIETWQPGNDQDIVVPVHFGWTGQDWAWWSTSHFYSPDPPPYPPPPYPPYPPTITPVPFFPWPWPAPVPTPGPGPAPYPNVPTPYPHYPVDIPTVGVPTGYIPVSSGGGTIAPSTATGGTTSTGGDLGGTISTDGGPSVPSVPPTPSTGSSPLEGVKVNPLYPGGIHPEEPGDDRHMFPVITNGQGQSSVGPAISIPGPTISSTILGQIPFLSQDTITGSSVTGPPIRTIASTAAIVSQAMAFGAQNYNANQTDGGLFGNLSSSALAKTSSSSPLTGMASTFGAQGGTIPSSPAPSPSPSWSPSPTPSPTPSPAPASTTGPGGDPWVYTASPRGQKMTGKQMSKYGRGTASGGIVFHPPETDLRDAPVGMVPNGVTLSTMTVAVGPNAYFAAGVPELTNGSIKSGYRWGVDTTTGDLVFYSVSFSQPAIEAIRFCNTGQVIRWKSTQGVYGELSHANTSNQRYAFPDVTGRVVVNTSVVADNGAGTIVTNGHTGGSGPVSATIARWLKVRADDGQDYFIEAYQ